MDNNEAVPTTDWKKTKEAVANFRGLLLCSKCSNLMKEPVCLGMCEHMLCRSCAGPRAGDGCVVCHSPAWVKDIQINRQLSSIVQLFCGLESLLGLTQLQDSSKAEIPPHPESPVLKHKKNFKIWFSPRSRKVRCMVQKPSEVTSPDSSSSKDAATVQPNSAPAQAQDLSVFNFTSSSQDSSSGCSEGCKNEDLSKKKRSTKKNAASRKVSVQAAPRSTRRQTKQAMKKSRLEAINQQWGITAEVDALKEKEQPCTEGARRSSKRVSFLSPPVTSEPEAPKPEAPKQSCEDICSDSSTVGADLSGCNVTEPNDQSQPCQNILDNDKLPANDPNPAGNPEQQDNVSTPKQSIKRPRAEQQPATPETTPKRPRASPCRRRKSQMSPAVLNPPSSASPRCDKNMKKSPRPKQGESPSFLTPVGKRSPGASSGRPTSGSPAVTKRNHKGETPLHLAAIKGDVGAVRELLDQGSDPNLKDNAGWTPLHEACNLGYLAVVEVLLSKGALLNTPGYENDSPLHDAVRNGHLAIVKLLLQHGALQNVLNLHGKQPVDYAVSPEMLQVFEDASEGAQNANTTLSPSASRSVVSDCARRDEVVVFLSSQLSESEQLQLAKLGEMLGWWIADTFSGSVSHVVVPEGPMPTTFSALLGLLAGCWIVKFSWVQACLQAGKWIPETEHEAGEGPQRSRINRCSLLPPLFDGCFFFLLGSFKAPPKDELTRLLREGGGQILSRQPKPDSDVTQTLSAAAYHAPPGSDQALCTQYIIFDPEGPHRPAVVRRGKVWSAPSTWIISCISAFQLLPVPAP